MNNVNLNYALRHEHHANCIQKLLMFFLFFDKVWIICTHWNFVLLAYFISLSSSSAPAAIQKLTEKVLFYIRKLGKIYFKIYFCYCLEYSHWVLHTVHTTECMTRFFIDTNSCLIMKMDESVFENNCLGRGGNFKVETWNTMSLENFIWE